MRAHPGLSGINNFVGFLLISCACLATEWPQYRGSSHNGVSGDRIQKQWGESGPKELWRVPCTNGLSSFAVAGDYAITQIRRNIEGADREVCVALDRRS